MERERRYPVMVAVKVSKELEAKIRQLAKDDDRPVSAYLRRKLADIVRAESEQRRGPASLER